MVRFLLVMALLSVPFGTAGVRGRDAQGAARSVQLLVTEAHTGQPLPCRITILDSQRNLAAIEPVQSAGIASRPGVLYTANGEARFTLPQGRYSVYVTRGMEYGLATCSLE